MTLDSYFGNRRFEIRWPYELVAAELDRLLTLADARQDLKDARLDNECERFFREAFSSPDALAEWQARRHTQTAPWLAGDSIEQASRKEWLRQMHANVDDLPIPSARAPYWSERRQARSTAAQLNLDSTARRFADLVDELEREGYFVWAFGQECVDGDSDGTLGSNPAAEMHRQLGREGLWPVRSSYDKYDLNDLCDVIEFLADHVRRPRQANYHGYSNCGWHYGDFDPIRGFEVYRWRVNELLDQSDLRLTLAEGGRLEQVAPGALEDLVSTVRQTEHVHAADASEFVHALTQFRSRGASQLDRRQAVVTLAGILERRRDLVKQELISKDEGALFQIANGFGIRHQRADQRVNYDSELYLEWVFYWYLATINLTNRIVQAQH